MHPNRWGQWKGFRPPPPPHHWMGWNGSAAPPPPPPPPPPPGSEYDYQSFSRADKEPGVPGEEEESEGMETSETGSSGVEAPTHEGGNCSKEGGEEEESTSNSHPPLPPFAPVGPQMMWRGGPPPPWMKFPPMFIPPQQNPVLQQAAGTSGTGKKKNKKKKKGAAPSLPSIDSIPTPPPTEKQTIVPPAPGRIPGVVTSMKPTTDASIRSAPQGLPASAMNNSDWPQSLKNYVSRCFSKCVTDIDKDQVEIILKGKITKAANDNTLWSKDWDSEPLPSNLSSDLSQPKIPKVPMTKPGPSGGYGAKFGNRLGIRRPRSPSPRSPGSKRNRKNKRDSDDESPEKERKQVNNVNPNRIPLGKGKQLGKKKSTDGTKVPYFYTNGQRNMTLDGDLATNERRQKRAARFADNGKRSHSKKQTSLLSTLNNQLLSETLDENSLHWESLHIVGTCQDLEKKYLRLTTAPEPHMVRPVNVLEKSLQMTMKHWLTKQDYHYACGQFKSIRQDLTVQGIRNEFTVKVYETHARVALEKGDYTEFNQCQSQLKMLYADFGGENRLEFTSYRILYYMYTKEALDIQTVLAGLTTQEKKDPCLVHILKLRTAWSEQNYHRFFQLYANSPKMSGYLIDWFINRERKAALRVIIKAYRVNVPISFIQKELGFLDPSTVTEDWNKFTEPFSLKYSDENKTMLDCKSSMACLKDMQ